MEIRARSKFDRKTITALAHLTFSGKNDPKKRLSLWVMILSGLALVILLESLLLQSTTLLKLLFLLALILFLEFFLYAGLPRIQYKMLARLQEAEHEFLFTDTALKAKTTAKDYSGESVLEYSLFTKVYETSDYFFLFQTANQVLIVDRSTLEGGNAGEIREKLASYVKKYIVCNY